MRSFGTPFQICVWTLYKIFGCLVSHLILCINNWKINKHHTNKHMVLSLCHVRPSNDFKPPYNVKDRNLARFENEEGIQIANQTYY